VVRRRSRETGIATHIELFDFLERLVPDLLREPGRAIANLSASGIKPVTVNNFSLTHLKPAPGNQVGTKRTACYMSAWS
jgi:hypothetical protein